MPVTVKRADLWTVDTVNSAGTLARTLAPLADSKVNLQVVMGYSHPDKTTATIEVYPVTSAASRRAARAAGFSKSAFPCVTVSGSNAAGLGRRITAALAEAGINLNFFVAQVIGKQYTGMFSFEADSEADLAVKIIRRAVKPPRRTAARARPRGATKGKRGRTAAIKTTRRR